MEEEKQPERNGGWGMFKEILATFIGVSPYIVALVIWGASVNERLGVDKTRLDHLEQEFSRNEQLAREQRTELIGRLERIAIQIEVLQQTVAKVGR